MEEEHESSSASQEANDYFMSSPDDGDVVAEVTGPHRRDVRV